MDAIVRAVCPKCQSVLRIPADWVGRVVRCKGCSAQFRSKPKAEEPAAPAAPEAAFGTAPMEVAPATVVPVPVSVPVAPAYAPPPGYAPPGYPYAPPGYAAPPAAAYPPGYGYPPAMAAPAPPVAGPVPVAAPLPSPVQPTKPGGAVPVPVPLPYPAYAPPAVAPYAPPAPVPPSNEFRVDPAAVAPTSGRRSRYRRSSGGSRIVWIGLCLLLTAGLVAGGIYGGKYLNDNFGTTKKETTEENAKNGPGGEKGAPGTKGGEKPLVSAAGGYPRRLLFVSITKYMYLNPLTQNQDGGPDKTKGAALRLAYDWRIPTDPSNNQVFVLSDTLIGPEARTPMKNVVTGAYQEFFNTSRAQDRITVYFGGHALEKGGKAYLAPMEAEPDGDDWGASLIPLDAFYAELAKCKAAQKLVIWDVCRYNPEKGRVRPGSEPMTEALFKQLSAPPAGVQAVVTCKPGENALEYSALRPDGFSGVTYSGSVFLESLRFVAEPKNGRMKRPPQPNPADPLPVAEWTEAVAKRANEMAEMGEKAGNTGKQSVALFGAPPEPLTAPDAAEKVAARFELPQAPKGASGAAIRALETEFNVPAIKPGLTSVGIADFPFPADVMKDYMPDGVSIDTVLKNKEEHAFRAAVLDALNKVREKWSDGAGTTKIRNQVEGPINDALKNEVKKEMEFWAIGIIELEDVLNRLTAVAPMRAEQPKRWQAHYDFALATLKCRLAYMNEYNKLLGNLVSETLPALDAKVGQDGYLLVASETLKAGKEAKTYAEEGQALFEAITKAHKGTPWAIQAKQEKAVTIGLSWKPASLKKGE